MRPESNSVLDKLDRIQRRLLLELGISAVDALAHFGLAPLSTRRDIAMLGVVHRAVFGGGPPHLRSFFVREDGGGPPHLRSFFVREDPTTRLTRQSRVHSRRLANPYWSCHQEYIRNSAFGYVSMYNMLPERVVASETPKLFQSRLQMMVRDCASDGMAQWDMLLSPRLPFHRHPLSRVS